MSSGDSIALAEGVVTTGADAATQTVGRMGTEVMGVCGDTPGEGATGLGEGADTPIEAAAEMICPKDLYPAGNEGPDDDITAGSKLSPGNNLHGKS